MLYAKEKVSIIDIEFFITEIIDEEKKKGTVKRYEGINNYKENSEIKIIWSYRVNTLIMDIYYTSPKKKKRSYH